MLKDIELRLGQEIQQLNPDLSLPKALVDRGVMYGEQQDGGVSSELMEHMEQIRGGVAKLAKLEWEAQSTFLNLSRRFTQPCL